jgi:hypothetical protein
VRRASIVLVVALSLDFLGAHCLDALGLVEGLLSPNGGRLLLIVPVAVSFYAARFVAWFIAPGLLLGALGVWLRDRRLTSGA